MRLADFAERLKRKASSHSLVIFRKIQYNVVSGGREGTLEGVVTALMRHNFDLL